MDSVIFDFSKKQFFSNYDFNYLGLKKHLYNQLLHVSKLTSVNVETLFYDIFYKQHLKIKLPQSTIETAKNWKRLAIQKFLNQDNIIEYLKSNYGLEEIKFNRFKNRKLVKIANNNDYVPVYRSLICVKNKLTIQNIGLDDFWETQAERKKYKWELQDLIDHKYSKLIHHEDLKTFKKKMYKDLHKRQKFRRNLSTRLNKRILVQDFLDKHQHLNTNKILLLVHNNRNRAGDFFEQFSFLYIKNNQYVKLGHSLNQDMSNKIVHSAYVL